METNPQLVLNYYIQLGEDVDALARKFRVSKEAILALNPKLQSNRLFVNQLVLIPLPTTFFNEVNQKNQCTDYRLLRNLIHTYQFWMKEYSKAMLFDLKEKSICVNKINVILVELHKFLKTKLDDPWSETYMRVVKDYTNSCTTLLQYARSKEQRGLALAEHGCLKQVDEMTRLLAYQSQKSMQDMNELVNPFFNKYKNLINMMLKEDTTLGLEAYLEWEEQALTILHSFY